MIAHHETTNARPHCLDYAGALMAEHNWLRGMAAGVLMQIGMADADGDDPYPHLAGARFLQLHLLEARLSKTRPADGGGDPHHGLPAAGGALCDGLAVSFTSPFHGT